MAATGERCRFSVLTYNVWFDPSHYERRMRAVLQAVEDLAPDFVCLQEVRPKFEQMVREATFVARDDGYDVSPYPIKDYGVLLLARRSLRARFETHDMETEQERVLLCAIVPDHDLVVCTAHFESLNARSLREMQLETASSVMARSAKASVLAGDFNFCSYRNYSGRGSLENDVLHRVLPAHVDCWPELRPAEKGFTFDSELNDNISQFERMRYDRILYDGSQFRPVRIELVGTEPLEPEGRPAVASTDPYATPPPRARLVFPSDHFGLVCEFESVVERDSA